MNADEIKKDEVILKELRENFNSPAIQAKLSQIEQKYNLTAKSADFRLLTEKVFAGEEDLDEFVDALIDKLDIDIEQAVDIDDEMYSEVFYDKEDEVLELYEKLNKGRKGGDPSQAENDAAEIDAIKTSLPRLVSGAIDYEKIANQILARLNFSAEDKVLEARFRNLVIAFLKEIRDVIETREILLRPQKIGGLGMNETESDQAIKILKDEALKLAQAKTVGISEKPKSELERMIGGAEKLETKKLETRDANVLKSSTNGELLVTSYQLPVTSDGGAEKSAAVERFRQEIKKAEKKFKAPYLEPEEEIEAPRTLPQNHKAPQIAEQKDAVRDFDLSRKPEAAKPKPLLPVAGATVQSPVRIKIDEIKVARKIEPAVSQAAPKKFTIPRPAILSRPQMEGARQTPRLLGPLEEIESITLTDFRKWSAEPYEAAERLEEKIKILEEESYEKRSLAIKAWRHSPLYWLYVRTGAASMEEKKTMGSIIEDWQAKGLEVLTQKEFEAIADLNRRLSL